jgi:cysteine-rich repeat protein
MRNGAQGVRGAVAAVTALALSEALFGGAALAHTTPVPIERWGPFLPGTPACLREISRVTHSCFDRVLLVLQQCNDAIVRGGSCDMEKVEDEITDLTRPLHTALTRKCGLGQLTELGYIGVPDAEADLFNACVTQARAMVSATYAPSLAGPPGEPAVECMTASGAYAREVVQFVLQQETPVFERMATVFFTKEQKEASVRQIETEMSAARPRWVTQLTSACPSFAAVYGRSADSFMRTVKQRADCVMSKTYIHNLINCLAAVCGNGIPEAGEECDDGNRDDTDTCLTNCSTP